MERAGLADIDPVGADVIGLYDNLSIGLSYHIGGRNLNRSQIAGTPAEWTFDSDSRFWIWRCIAWRVSAYPITLLRVSTEHTEFQDARAGICAEPLPGAQMTIATAPWNGAVVSVLTEILIRENQ